MVRRCMAGATTFVVSLLACGSVAHAGVATEVSDVSPRSFVGAAGGKVIFTVDEPNRTRLWMSDGTAKGTRRVPGVDLGPSGQGSGWSAQLPNKVIFLAEDRVHGLEWWVTDGTLAGTRMLADVFPGAEGQSTSFHPVRVGGQVLMKARDPEHGLEWWRTDGTPAGTRLLADVNPGPGGSLSGDWLAPDPPVAGHLLYFMAIAPGQGGWELWRTDGTKAGTISLGLPWASDGLVGGGHDGVLYFTDRDGWDREGADIWRSDGTPEGTGPFANLAGPDNNTRFEGFGFAAGNLFFNSYWNPGTIWSSDGTPEGTKPLLPSTPGAAFRDLAQLGGKAIFIREESGGSALFTTDGTSAGTKRVAGLPELGGPEGLHVVGDTAIFNDYAYPAEKSWIWTLQAGAQTARPVQAHRPDGGFIYTGGAAVGDVFYFAALKQFENQNSTETSLWKIDLGDSKVELAGRPLIARHQRAKSRSNVARAKVSGDEGLKTRVAGAIFLRRRWKPLRGQRKRSAPGSSARLRVATRDRRDWRVLRRRLREPRGVPIRLKLTVSDRAGNSRRTRKLIHVR